MGRSAVATATTMPLSTAGLEIEVGQRQLSLQEALRERRPLVGRMRLVPQQEDAPLVALLSQAGGQLASCMAGSHDDDGFFHCRDVPLFAVDPER